MKVKIRTANNTQEINQAYNLAAHLWWPNHRTAQERKIHLLKKDPIENPDDVVVAINRDKIIGMIRIVKRRNYFLGQLLKNAGITYVCVAPSYRGRGIGGALVNTAIDVMRKKAYPFSIVIARRAVDGFYSKYGYIGTGLFSELAFSNTLLKGKPDRDKFVFETGFKKRYLRKYAVIYTINYNNVPWAFYRPQRWWDNIKLELRYRITHNSSINVITKGTFIGYFILYDGKIIEAASYPKYAFQFYNAMSQYMLRKGLKQFSIALSNTHHCYKYYMGLNNTVKIRRVWNGGHMIRIIDTEKIKSVILDYLDRECSEFSRKIVRKAKNEISAIINNNDSKVHNEAANIILKIIQQNANPAIGKVAKNMQQSWSLIDEF